MLGLRNFFLMLLFGIMFHSLNMSFHEAGSCSDQFWDFIVRIELSFCKQITCHANGLLCLPISWNLFELEFYSTNSEKSSIFCLLWVILGVPGFQRASFMSQVIYLQFPMMRNNAT